MTKKLVTACRAVVMIGLVSCMILASGSASALSYRHMSDTEIKATVTRLVSDASTGGAGDSDDLKTTLELAVRVRPIIEMTDAKCPMPIKVMNGTSVPFFNVKVQTTERRGKTGTPNKTIFHIPYLPAKSTVSGTVACTLKQNPYGIGDRDVYLSASPIGEHSRLDDDGIREMIRTKEDATTSSYSFVVNGSSALGLPKSDDDDDLPLTGDDTIDEILRRNRARANGARPSDSAKPDAGAPAGSAAAADSRPSIVGAILQGIESETDFKLFASGMLRSSDGAKEIGKFVRGFPGRPILASLVPLLAAAPGPKVAFLLDEGMREEDQRASTLLIAAASRVCAAGQPEDSRASMWLGALSPDVKNTAARDAILAKCGVGKEQTRARLKAAKGDQLGRALDGMQGDLFDVAVGAMVESKSQLAAEELLSKTQNAKKFDAVAKAAPAFVTTIPKRQELARAVAAGPSGALDETKAKWLDERLTELHAQSNGDRITLRDILHDMAAGQVTNSEVRKVVFAHRKDAGSGAFEPFKTSLGDKSLVLSPAWAIAKAEAGELDIFDVASKLRQAAAESVKSTGSSSYSSYSREPTTGCQSSAANAMGCVGALEELKVPLTKDSFDPSFIDAAVGFVRDTTRDERSVDLLKRLAGHGVDVTPAVTALCSAAPTEPGRYGYGSGFSDPLNSAIALGADNACIAHVKSQRGSAERLILAGMGVRLVLAFIPFGFVALLARRRFVPVRAQLAKENAELDKVRGKPTLTTRLESPGSDDAIASGITDAARWLTEQAPAADASAPPSDEVAAAGRALAALTPERRAALVARTRSLATRAGETGAVATCLCELEGIVVYLACFPGREDQPQTVRRQPGFAEGWSAHTSALLDACAADGKPKRVLSLVTMLRTDGTRMTMLVGYDSDAVHLVPEALAGDTTQSDVVLRTHEHRYEISQNASATAATA